MQEIRQEKSLIKQNILQYIDFKGISKYEFYKKTKITRGILDQNNGISEDNIARFLAYFKDVNIVWLITGIGNMTLDECLNDHKYASKNAPENAHPSNKIKNQTSEGQSEKQTDYRLVPLYNFDVAGGIVNTDTDTTLYIEGYVPFLEAKSDDICMHVTGRSMLPTYAAGTIVLLHPVYQWREFLEYGEIYVIDLKDERRLIKEIRRSEENCKENFLLFSHNPDYDPIDIPKNLINKIWLVKAMYQKTTM